MFVAQQEGYFAEQGLDVEFTRIFTSGAIVAISKGELDVMSTFLSASMFNAIAQGANLKIVGGKGFIDPNACTVNGMLLRQDLIDKGQLDDLNNLAGMRIGIDRFTIEDFFMSRLLQDTSLSLEDLEIINLDPFSEMEALRDDAIDITLSAEPWVTRTLNDGHSAMWMDFSEMLPNYQFAVILFGQTLLTDSPELGEGFMAAYVKAIQQLAEGKTERNLQLLSEFTELDTELLEQVCWPTFRVDGSINVDRVIEFQDWLASEAVLEEVLTPEQFWDPRFVESVK